MSSIVYLTRKGYEKLSKELESLKTSRRRELSREIGRARLHGDLSENAEYHAAKEAQFLNEKKIAEMEEQLSRAQIVDDRDIPKDRIRFGATVELRDLDSGEELRYTLVSEVEADFSCGKISVASPVGKSLIGHKEDETVEISIPAGTLRYKILKIS